MEALEARFRRHVDTSGDCWLWTGARYADGYGQIAVNGSTRPAHCLAFEFANGPIPPGANVLHRCENRHCVRPDHLWLGDATARAALRDARGRGGRGEKPRAELHSGRQFTWADVRTIRRRYAAGGVTTRQLADEYHVRQNSIWKIVTGRSWTEQHHHLSSSSSSSSS